MGDAQAAGGGGETKSPQEHYNLIFMSISTEPKKMFFYECNLIRYKLIAYSKVNIFFPPHEEDENEKFNSSNFYSRCEPG